MHEVNDELMMPCAQCARKHLSAAIAHYADSPDRDRFEQWGLLLARAMINLCEATEGYASHEPFAVGLFVRAEEECMDIARRREIRAYRLAGAAGRWNPVPVGVFIGAYPSECEWYLAHVAEAEREYPEIRTAVERESFFRDGMSGPELRQAEVNYRLAQLKWLDENVFGQKPVEKGEAEMAMKKANPFAKKGAKADPKAAKKACKGGKCKGKGKACGK